jgi:GNAT superfamily N-acetyltransferase
MPDMLVKLYDQDFDPDAAGRLAAEGIEIRRALAPEKSKVLRFVEEYFGEGWMSECDVAFANTPCSCFIAVKEGKPVGFACCEATCRGFFGPTGVLPQQRGRGVGAALLFACLQDLKARGYAYAVIGGAGPTGFYEKACGAVVIEGSEPGIYRGML